MKATFSEKTAQVWNEFVMANNGSFLQSFEWGEFQEKRGKKIWRIIVQEQDTLILQTLLIEEKLPWLKYLYIPYGPVFDSRISEQNKKDAIEKLLNFIKTDQFFNSFVFLRIEPVVDLPEISLFPAFIPKKRIQPQKTSVLNIEKTQEELLASFHQKTRYNIRLAEQKGVKIRILDEYLPAFYQLLSQTKERQNFSGYAEDYYKELLKIKSENFYPKIFWADFQGKIIVASIIIFFGKRAISLHTGSDYDFRHLKAPQLLRWQTILEAKKMGCLEYDLWGIDEIKWPGVTYLKQGFCGREINYGQGRDYVFKKFAYIFYKIFQSIELVL